VSVDARPTQHFSSNRQYLNPETSRPERAKERVTMLMTIVVILIVLWALGLVTSYTMGGLIHVLLVIAIIVVLVRVISGRKPV
jgi:hypothetical protein